MKQGETCSLTHHAISLEISLSPLPAPDSFRAMNFSRRDFLKTASAACGAATIPAWVLETEAAEAAALDKNKLAEVALARARKLGATYADIRINRYRNEAIF